MSFVTRNSGKRLLAENHKTMTEKATGFIHVYAKPPKMYLETIIDKNTQKNTVTGLKVSGIIIAIKMP